jgi:hypothetical protein
MKSIRHFATRRVLTTSLAACGLTVGLAAGAPAAHAGTGCAWQPITLENGWQSEQGTYGTGDPSVCLESDGMVYLSGSVGAPNGSSSSEFGVLPVWDWPNHNLYFDTYTLNGSYGVLRIDTDGTMWAYGGLGGSTGYTSLAGISYPDPAVTQTDLPLENGWQSADSMWATGDPAYSVTGGVVHLSGSLRHPSGTPAPASSEWNAAVLPSYARPSDGCFGMNTYTFGGNIGWFPIDNASGTLAGAGTGAQYTSLAGVNYPAIQESAWQKLPMLNGQQVTGFCNGLSYYTSGNVVYLNGYFQVPPGFNGAVGILPPAARPSHYLWMTASTNGSISNPASTFDVLRIDPDGSMWIFSPHGAGNLVSVSGMSFHLGS